MNNEETFDAWAPVESPWSAWAKPVLFARMNPSFVRPATSEDWRSIDAAWATPPSGGCAMIVDLPGAESVATGMALARIGYRPVPLFNAVMQSDAVRDLSETATRLFRWADDLRNLRLPPEAPPAFLLDSLRMHADVPPRPGSLDNRSMVFPQDFPSGATLHARGIRHVVRVRAPLENIQDDLQHILLRWKEAGLQTHAQFPGGPLTPFVPKRPSRFRAAWYRACAILGLRRSAAGGFGSRIPEPSSSGSGYRGFG